MTDSIDNLIDITDEVDYIYVTIPKEYICIYHKILTLLADYGIDMLKDCKASCTDKSSNIIECFNMFNAAVAAHELGKTSLANAIITYVKAKLEQIYKTNNDSDCFTFIIDKEQETKAFITCNDGVHIYVSSDESSDDSSISSGTVSENPNL